MPEPACSTPSDSTSTGRTGLSSADACFTCGAGFDNIVDATKCQTTAANFYSPANNNARTACSTPSDSTSTGRTGLSSADACFTCGAGFDNIVDATKCQTTAANFYSPANNNARTACSTPSDSTSTGRTGLSSADACFTCGAGFDNIVDATKCQTTAANFYSPANNNARTACSTPSDSTSTGRTGLSSADACFTCGAGFDNIVDATKCQTTAANFYSPANNNARTACSTPSDSTSTGRTGLSSADACFTCGAGFDNIVDATKCQTTAANFYSPANNNARTACSTPSDSTSTGRTGLSSADACFTCGAGFDNIVDATKCQTTAANFYSPANNNARTACSTPSDSTSTGRTGLSSADACFTCGAGFDNIVDATKCQTTAANFYSPANNNARTACSTPSDSTSTGRTGLSSADACFTCGAGFDNIVDATKCQTTAANFYSPANNNARTACSTPSDSTSTGRTGLSSADACFTCGAGFDNIVDATKCQTTAANFYSPANNNARTACSTPSDSTSTGRTGLSSADACFTCGAGFDNIVDATKCQTTAANFYSPANNNARTACSTPSDSTSTGRTGLSSADACFTCGAGFDNIVDATKCQTTAANFYSPANNNARTACSTPSDSTSTGRTGLSSADACFTCGAGFDNIVDATKCQTTAMNYYSLANSNIRFSCPTPANSSSTTRTGLSSTVGCFTCDGGHDNTQDPTKCESTAVNYYSLANSNTRTPCPTPANSSSTTTTGLFSTVGCYNCDAGFVKDAAADTCNIPDPGMYADSGLSKACTDITGDGFSAFAVNTAAVTTADGCSFSCTSGYTVSRRTCSKAKMLALGAQTSRILFNNGDVDAWGGASTVPWRTYIKKENLGSHTPQALASGGFHQCIILENSGQNHGSLMCWGGNSNGQLGVGDTNSRTTPEAVTATFLGDDGNGVTNTVKSVSAGHRYTCAILSDDTVKCWGDDSSGQTGGAASSTDTSLKVAVGGTAGNPLSGGTAKRLSSGQSHACAILNDDTVRCWGLDSTGQAGGNSGIPNLGGKTATEIAAGDRLSCAILSDDTVKCWGKQVLIKDTPTAFVGTPTGIAAGSKHACALLADKTVKCWGADAKGQIGGGLLHSDSVLRGTKGDPLGGQAVIQIAASYRRTCAIMEWDNSIKCWGENVFDQQLSGHKFHGQIVGGVPMTGGSDGTGMSSGTTGILTASSTPTVTSLDSDKDGQICGVKLSGGTLPFPVVKKDTSLKYNGATLSGSSMSSNAITNFITAINKPGVSIAGTTVTFSRPNLSTNKIVATASTAILDGITLTILHDNNGGDCSSPLETPLSSFTGGSGAAPAEGYWVISEDYTGSGDETINLDSVHTDLENIALSKEKIADKIVADVTADVTGRSWAGKQYEDLPYTASTVDGGDSSNDGCPANDFCVHFTRLFNGAEGNYSVPFGDSDYTKPTN